jgi:hypothetical protein
VGSVPLAKPGELPETLQSSTEKARFTFDQGSNIKTEEATTFRICQAVLIEESLGDIRQ